MEEKVVQPIYAPSTQPPAPVAEPPVAPAPQPEPVATEIVEEEKTTEQKAGELVPQDHYLTSPLFYEVTSYFGIEQGEFDSAKNKLSVIVDWAAEAAQSGKTEDILVKIRELEDKLTPPGWGERRYANVYKYVRLAQQRNSVDKAMSAFTRSGGKYGA